MLAAFVEPALALAQDRHGGGAFIRVIARAYAEKNDSLRKFLSDQYGHVLREFAKAIAGCCRGLSKEELYWRLDFLSGALTYAMADFGMIKRPSGVSEASASRHAPPRELIRFAAAGLALTAEYIHITFNGLPHMPEKLLVRTRGRARRRRDGRADRRPPDQRRRRHGAVRPAGRRKATRTASCVKAIANLGKLSPAPLAAKIAAASSSRRPTTTTAWSCCAAAT